MPVLLEKSISPNKRKCVILLERIDEPKANRVPMYKTVSKIDDRNNEDKESVHDFQFDLNDPGKKTARNNIQRKKPARKQTVTKREKKPVLLPKINTNEQKKADKPLGNDQIQSKNIVNDDKDEISPAQIQITGETESDKDSSSMSVLLEKSISPNKRKCVILLERIDEPKANREPVYKAVSKIDDRNNEDKESVYDFQFDLNDPREKTARKKLQRKKPARKQTVTKRKKKPVLLPKINTNEQKKADKPLKNDQVQSENIVDDDKDKKSPAQIQITGETESDKIPEPPEAPVSPQNPIPLSKLEDKGSRARICSVETLTGDRKVSFMPNLSLSRKSSAKFNPFRSTQSIFRPRSTMHTKEMIDHSLLNKSLSPIKGEVEPFDPASPWRSPQPSSFSSVRRIVQSTPQAKKSFMRTGQAFTIDENEENEENAGDKPTPSPKMAGKRTVNPLGVRISNAENIQASSPRKSEQLVPQETNTKLVTKKPLGLASGFGENRQNSGFGDRLYISPKKSEIRSSGLKRRKNPLGPMGEETENLSSQNKDAVSENEVKSQPTAELKLMRQGNLNTYLNLDEMPESIRINTSHGIFGNENSATLEIKNNQAPNTPVLKPSIENCFGFDEDCSDVQLSPKKLEKKRPTPLKKMFQRLKGRVLPKEKQVAARISLGEIKNTLYPRREPRVVEKPEKGNGEKKDVDLETEKDPGNKTDNTKSKNLLDPVQFSDTFDLLSESGQTKDDGKSVDNEIPLFTDLEPVHFTKPPRWSYVKKRDRKQYWTSDEDDKEDEDSRDEPVLKKRKLIKLNKAEEKKIDEWVKSVNETFQEIDDFDLVVEKLS